MRREKRGYGDNDNVKKLNKNISQNKNSQNKE